MALILKLTVNIHDESTTESNPDNNSTDRTLSIPLASALAGGSLDNAGLTTPTMMTTLTMPRQYQQP